MNLWPNPDQASGHHPAPPSSPAAPYTASDLPIDGSWQIHPLPLRAEQIAPDLWLVGDPGWAGLIGSRKE
jgi:hypothetical protein